MDNAPWQEPVFPPNGAANAILMTRSGDEVAAPIVRRNGIVPPALYRGISSMV